MFFLHNDLSAQTGAKPVQHTQFHALHIVLLFQEYDLGQPADVLDRQRLQHAHNQNLPPSPRR